MIRCKGGVEQSRVGKDRIAQNDVQLVLVRGVSGKKIKIRGNKDVMFGRQNWAMREVEKGNKRKET